MLDDFRCWLAGKLCEIILPKSVSQFAAQAIAESIRRGNTPNKDD